MFHFILTIQQGRKRHWKNSCFETAGREVGKRDTVPGDRKCGECLVLGDANIRNVGSECLSIIVECITGIRTEPVLRVTEHRARKPR